MEVKLCVAKEARRKSNIEVLEIKYGGIEMTLKEIFEAGGGILFVVLTLVQVAPIKVNPWTALGRSIGRVLKKSWTKSRRETLRMHVTELFDLMMRLSMM